MSNRQMCHQVKALTTRNSLNCCGMCGGPVPRLYVNVVLCDKHGANLLCDECYEVAQ